MKVKLKIMLLVMSILTSVVVMTACSGTTQKTSNSGGVNTASQESKDQTKETKETGDPAIANFPEHEITIVVSNKAGGSNDIAARAIATPLQQVLGVPVVVDNVDGAGGNIARNQVFNAEPDGYTLLKTPIPSMAIGELVADGDFKTLEFEPVFNIFGNTSNVVIVPTDSPYETIDDLIEASKEKNLTASGSGTATNTALGSLFLQEIGIKHQYVPFDGGTEAAQQVAGGHVDFGIASEVAAKSLESEGLVRVIATTGTARMDMFPDAPTLMELGHKEYGFEIMYAIWAPPGTPKEIVDKLSTAFMEAAQDEAFKEAGARAGFIEQLLLSDELRERRDFSYGLVERFKENLK